MYSINLNGGGQVQSGGLLDEKLQLPIYLVYMRSVL